MNMFRKIIGFLFLVICVSQNIALAFKPTNETYGHTMITRHVLSAGGYSFGSGYTVPQFLVNNKSFSEDAIESIVLGVQSRDWIGLDGVHCSGIEIPQAHVACQFYFGANLGGLVITGDLNDEDGHFDNDNFVGSTRAIHKLIRSGPDWEVPIFTTLGLGNKTIDVSYAFLSVTDLLKKYVINVSPGVTPTQEQRQMLTVARIKLGKALHTLQDFYAHSTWANIYGPSDIFTPITDKLLLAGPLLDFNSF